MISMILIRTGDGSIWTCFDTAASLRSSVFTEDRAEQLLFRGELGFGLRRDFADEDVAGLHFRTDANDAVVVEVLQRFLTDVRDVARDFFRPELRVTSGDFELLDVDRR